MRDESIVELITNDIFFPISIFVLGMLDFHIKLYTALNKIHGVWTLLNILSTNNGSQTSSDNGIDTKTHS
jgi:hypothetical protein